MGDDMTTPRYTLTAGRTIERDGVAIAYIQGVTVPLPDHNRFQTRPYALGSPADLDVFAHTIVTALNVAHAVHERALRDNPELESVGGSPSGEATSSK